MTTGILEIMRGRKRLPGGRRNTISAKYSDDEAALLHAARDGARIGPWLREASLAAARQQVDARIRERLGISIAVDGRMPPGTMKLVTPGQPPLTVTGLRPDSDQECPHPAARVLKGLCRACGTYVGG